MAAFLPRRRGVPAVSTSVSSQAYKRAFVTYWAAAEHDHVGREGGRVLAHVCVGVCVLAYACWLMRAGACVLAQACWRRRVGAGVAVGGCSGSDRAARVRAAGA